MGAEGGLIMMLLLGGRRVQRCNAYALIEQDFTKFINYFGLQIFILTILGPYPYKPSQFQLQLCLVGGGLSG